MNKLFNAINLNKDRYIAELFEFLRCKSISTTNEGIEECAKLLKKMMERCGIKTTIYPTAGHPVVYGEYIVDPTYPTILVYGHYDVQPPEPYEEWESDPFEPEIRSDRIYARGASDNKGQLFTYFKALEVYKEIYGEPRVNFKYLVEGEEEISSPHLNDFVKNHKELLTCDFTVLSDSCIHESGTPLIVLGLKGMAFAEIELTGAKSDLHSMKASGIPSPLWRMVSLLHSIKEDDDGMVKIEGFYDNVRPPTEMELEAIDKIPYDKEQFLKDHGVSRVVKGRFGDHYYYNLICEPTCNIAGLFGGYAGVGSKTVLPNKATVKIDMRLVPNQTPEEIYLKIRKHLDSHGFEDAKLTCSSTTKPSRTSIENPYTELFHEAIVHAWEQEPLVYPSLGGAGPNYVFTDTLGVPCFMIPFSYTDHGNHAPNENIRLKGFYNGIRTIAALIHLFRK